jgi:hypothetical protein
VSDVAAKQLDYMIYVLSCALTTVGVLN